VFLDTSGLYALLVRSEDRHADVLRVFRKIVEGGHSLWTTSYVLVETVALLQHRLGLDPVRDFTENVVPVLSVAWVTEPLHYSVYCVLQCDQSQCGEEDGAAEPRARWRAAGSRR
jgi:predicted nucleic acid-binding protein